MLETLPRNPKATGKKPLGMEERTGVSGGPGGEEEGNKADIPYSEAQALAPGRAAPGPWGETCPGVR